VHARTRDHAQVRFVRHSASETSRPQASLTRCLGGLVPPPTTTCGPATRLQQGDTIVLCSDGLWGQVPDQALTETFAGQPAALGSKLQTLAERAAAQPGSDNVTAVALRWQATAASTDQAALLEPRDDPQLEQAIQHLHSVLEKTGQQKQ
jgi:serine/threonine protein phosphatase PrpC